MADIKSAQAWLAEVPKHDSHKLVTELSEWVESVSAQTDFKPDHQFAALRMLDEAAQPHARKLSREYFVRQELGRFHENRLWLALSDYHGRLAAGYGALFERYCGGKGGGAVKAHLPLIAGRALHAAIARLKYVSARYGPADDAAWIALARFYRHAEQENYLDAGFALYPGASGATTVRCCAGHLLGWYGCGAGALSPLDIHVAERIVGQYAAAISVGEQPAGDSLFSFDLDQPEAPARVRPNGAVRPSMRFVGMAGMLPRLDALLGSLDKNIVPDELNLGGRYEADRVRGPVRHLLDYLNAPPVRRDARRGINVRVQVANGFARLVECAGAGRDFGAEELPYWEIADASASGFRALLPGPGGEGVRIGSLLGVRPDGVPHWGVAVVRRLVRDGGKRWHVGAEMLSSRVDGVALNRSGGGGGFEDGQPGLWLHAQPGDGATEAGIRLLMKADTFSMQRSLQTGLNGRSYLLIPGGVQEKGGDYDLARFRLIEQEPSSDEPG